MSNFDSTKTRLAALLQDIEKGKIQLPDFQRGWVWDDSHRYCRCAFRHGRPGYKLFGVRLALSQD
jgi:hypothetical protein